MYKRFYFLSMLICLSAVFALIGCEDDASDNPSDPGTENDYFKLSDTKRVEMASSNLYWDGARFRFEPEAYSYPKAWDEAHVGHFYWSKNLAQSYAQSYDEYESARIGDLFCWDESLKSLRTVEGDTGWYVPSAQEWDYLISHHAYLYCNLIKVAGDTVFGLMVLPYGTSQFLLQGSRVSPDRRTTYNMGMADFQSNLQHHAAFFPGAFHRDGSRIGLSRDGKYLTSTPFQSMPDAAECFNFYEYGITAWFGLGRGFGGSIRLVRNK